MERAGRRMGGKSVASAVEAKSAVCKRRVMLDVVTRAQRRNKISTSRVEVGNLDATPNAPPPGGTYKRLDTCMIYCILRLLTEGPHPRTCPGWSGYDFPLRLI